MKKIKVITLSAVTLLSALTLALPVHAAVNGEDQTPTEVKITDATDPKNPNTDPLLPEDPTNPVDPSQSHLVLNKVPTAYKFTSSVSNNQYTISSGTIGNGNGSDKNIVVFNDRTNRNWQVKASVVGNKLTLGSDDFTVSNFQVNNTEIAATGSKGIVFDSTETDGVAGTKTKSVNSISIIFNDPNGILKAGDTINGTISYQLFNTVTPS
ncbi:hypothetical protein P3T75_12735 [Enterococcus montenegrensis]|uniref:hypothetical protein n=1 Tax=Enterococcus montenegrensis TaxID=3031993 RepID=UPI00249DD3E5|nr:hypothetical protein [Enterococcus montenegrensis]WHA09125.1 hypothetical protein P3T75_12735 [Enterococcus montenegrensis]